MRKILMLAGVVVALAIPAAALAATLDTGKFGDFIDQGSACTHGAFYHIVDPGSGGADDNTLLVWFDGVQTGPYSSYQSPGNTTHYLVFHTGTLTGASNSLDGKLVISGVACKKGAPGK